MSKEGIRIPPELWLIIARVLEPNPIVYINLSRVCRSSRAVFLADRLWCKLVPHEVERGGYYYAFEKQMRRKPKALADEIRENWKQVLVFNSSANAAPPGAPPQLQPHARHRTHMGRTPRQHQRVLDPDLALSLCLNEGFILGAKFDISFWKCALMQNPLLFEHAPRQFYTNPDLLLYAIQEADCSPVFLENGAPILEEMRVAAAAVERAPNILSKMRPEFLKENPKILMRALELYPWVIIQDSLAPFRNDPEVALQVVSQNGQLLGVLGSRVKAQRSIVLAAVSNYGAALQNSPEYATDREVVFAAVSNNGMALKYASPTLRQDKQLVLAAVSNNGDARSLAAPKLQYDKDIVVAALRSMRR